jgi:phosphohistidine phosphatase
MKLYFFRHGHAEDAQAPQYDDFSRRLTDKGIRRTEAAGRALLKLDIKPHRLYTSPVLRARQTGNILAKHLGMSVSVQDEVGFGFGIQHIGPLIADLGVTDEVMFVGHEPDLSVTLSALIGGGEMVMKKGGLARVDLFSRAPLRGTLTWMLAPRILDGLAS